MNATTAKPRRQTLPAARDHSFRSNCSISRALELLGDKWTLLIVRDLLWHDKHTFKELANAENMPTNLLSDRLQRLMRWGLVRKEPYQENPVRYAYHLTDAGRELEDTLLGIMRWGNRRLAGGWYDPAMGTSEGPDQSRSGRPSRTSR